MTEKTPAIVAWLEGRSVPTPSARRAGWSPVCSPALPWRTRPGRPTRSGRAQPPSCTSWRTSGSATPSRCSAGATSGSTRVSPRSWRSRTTRRTAARTPRSGSRRSGRPSASRRRLAAAIGDPGPGRIFARPGLPRGAMTLQALRHRVGEDDFWTILRTWVADREPAATAPWRTSPRSPRSLRRGPRRLFEAWLSGTRPPRPHRCQRSPGPGRTTLRSRRPASGPPAVEHLLQHPRVEPRRHRPDQHPHQADRPGEGLWPVTDQGALARAA